MTLFQGRGDRTKLCLHSANHRETCPEYHRLHWFCFCNNEAEVCYLRFYSQENSGIYGRPTLGRNQQTRPDQNHSYMATAEITLLDIDLPAAKQNYRRFVL